MIVENVKLCNSNCSVDSNLCIQLNDVKQNSSLRIINIKLNCYFSDIRKRKLICNSQYKTKL